MQRFGASVGLLLILLLASGCYSSSGPGPTPGEMADVVAALESNGFHIDQTTGGDAGCTGSELHRDAVRLNLTYSGDGKGYVVYLLRWRNQADFDAAADAFSQCISDFASTISASGVTSVEVSPWRAFGAGLTDQLRTALDLALRAAATAGGGD